MDMICADCGSRRVHIVFTSGSSAFVETARRFELLELEARSTKEQMDRLFDAFTRRDPWEEWRQKMRDQWRVLLRDIVTKITAGDHQRGHAWWLRFHHRTACRGHVLRDARARAARPRRSQARACALDRARNKRKGWISTLKRRLA